MDVGRAYKLETLEEIDGHYQWKSGDDGNLDPQDPGYTSLKQKVSQTVSAFPKYASSSVLDAEKLEQLDKKSGFSGFERLLAYELMDGFDISYGHNKTQLPGYWSALSVAAKDLCKPRDEAWIKNASLAYDEGYKAGKGEMKKDLSSSRVEGLWEAGFAESLIRYGADTVRYSPSPKTPLTDMMTGQDLMFAALYGSLGVYEVGHLQEGQDVYGNAYVSEVDKFSPYYGQLFACRIFEHYQSLRESGALGDQETYTIYEHGGGDGKLAQDILGYVQERAYESPDWMAFWNQLRYEGIEIATSAYETQKTIETNFPGKFIARLGDAITYTPEQKGKGIVISSLLLDSFPHHTLHYAENKWEMGLIIPTIAFADSTQRDEFLNQFFPGNKKRVLKESNTLMSDYIGEGADDHSFLCFQKKEFEEFSNALSALKDTDPDAFKRYYSLLKERGQFLRTRGDIEVFPEVADFVSRHSFLESVTGFDTIWVNTEADRYLANVTGNYFIDGAGAMMTTDLFYPPDPADPSGISPLMAQAGKTYRDQVVIPMELFGGYVFYSGLQSNQLGETLKQNGAEKILIQPQEELWAHHPKKPEDVVQEAYANHKDSSVTLESYLDDLTHFNTRNGQYLFAEF